MLIFRKIFRKEKTIEAEEQPVLWPVTATDGEIWKVM